MRCCIQFFLQRFPRAVSTAFFFGVGAFGLAPSASALIFIDFVYDGTDTRVDFSVEENSLAGTLFLEDSGAGGVHYVKDGGMLTASSNVSFYESASLLEYGPWDSDQVADSFEGDSLYLLGAGSFYFAVARGTDISSSLEGSMTWLDTSLTDLGFASNEYAEGSYAAAGTTVNWTAGPVSAVPEPSTYALISGLVLGGFVFYRRRRRAA